jgi:hypothetical protein
MSLNYFFYRLPFYILQSFSALTGRGSRHFRFLPKPAEKNRRLSGKTGSRLIKNRPDLVQTKSGLVG